MANETTATPHGRAWVGAAVAAVPHVLILTMMAASVVRADGVERGYAGYLGFLEIYVVPLAVLTAAGIKFFPRISAWSMGIVCSTLAGMAVVILAALVVGNGDTWR